MVGDLKEIASPQILLSTLILGLGWMISTISNRIHRLNLIEWNTKQILKGNSIELQYNLENITIDKNFKSLKFVLYSDQFYRGTARTIFYPPGAAIEVPLPEMQEDTISFLMPEFQPGWRVTLSVKYKDPHDKTNIPKLNILASGQTIQLMRRNYKTFMVKNEIEILIALSIVWILALLFIMVTNFFRKKKNA